MSLFLLNGPSVMSLIKVGQERFSFLLYAKKSMSTKTTQAHKEAITMLETAKKNLLLNLNSQSQQTAFQTTARVCKAAYYVTKKINLSQCSKVQLTFNKLIP